jgi:hypothetical protein
VQAALRMSAPKRPAVVAPTRVSAIAVCGPPPEVARNPFLEEGPVPILLATDQKDSIHAHEWHPADAIRSPQGTADAAPVTEQDAGSPDPSLSWECPVVQELSGAGQHIMIPYESYEAFPFRAHDEMTSAGPQSRFFETPRQRLVTASDEGVIRWVASSGCSALMAIFKAFR